MKRKGFLTGIPVLFFISAGLFVFARQSDTDDDRFIRYIADTKKQRIQLYWKDEQGKRIGSIARLKVWLSGRQQTLLFAMNGGMYQQDHSPVGLYIENGKMLSPLDTAKGNGNFYLKPNGVFYITKDDKAAICTSADFVPAGNIKYATQSGPMLLVTGSIHPAFTKGSANTTIRNGAGILPDGNIVFAMSKAPVNLYDFAAYFKSLGCKNALYFDGFVSRMYLPARRWMQTDGDFGVMIGVVSPGK